MLFLCCFFLTARDIPEDIYMKVLQSPEFITYMEDVDTFIISRALLNESLINLDDFSYFTNLCVHGQLRRTKLFYTTLTQAGYQPNIVVKVHQALLKSPVDPHLTDALRRCGEPVRYHHCRQHYYYCCCCYCCHYYPCFIMNIMNFNHIVYIIFFDLTALKQCGVTFQFETTEHGDGG